MFHIFKNKDSKMGFHSDATEELFWVPQRTFLLTVCKRSSFILKVRSHFLLLCEITLGEI